MNYIVTGKSSFFLLNISLSPFNFLFKLHMLFLSIGYESNMGNKFYNTTWLYKKYFWGECSGSAVDCLT